MKERVFGACVLIALALPGIAPARAQPAPPAAASPNPLPVTGFVSSYEIMRTIREAGFEPLAPPLREGTDYVLRATDFRGILMRVVVDARTAAIRDVTRIVPGPGRYGQFYPEPVYGPADLDDPMGPTMGAPIGAGFEPPPVRPPAAHLAPNPAITPLPRPRPATLASRKPNKTETNSSAAAAAKPEAAPDAKSQINSEVITAVPPPASAGPKRAPVAVEPLND